MNTQRRFWHERHRRFTVIDGDSKTMQSHAESADVNYIVNRYQRTGELPQNPRGLEGRYEDVTGLQKDLTEAYNDSIETIDDFYAEQAKAEAEQNQDDSWNAQEQEDNERQRRHDDKPPVPEPARRAGDAGGSARSAPPIGST